MYIELYTLWVLRAQVLSSPPPDVSAPFTCIQWTPPPLGPIKVWGSLISKGNLNLYYTYVKAYFGTFQRSLNTKGGHISGVQIRGSSLCIGTFYVHTYVQLENPVSSES